MYMPTSSRHPELASTLSRGVIVPTLTPFDDDGEILLNVITDQTRRLARIDGIIGIAVHTGDRERKAMTPSERADVIRGTHAGLAPGQLLLSHIGLLSDTAPEEAVTCKMAGADAAICLPSEWQKGSEDAVSDDHISALTDLADRLPLPLIFDMGRRERPRSMMSDLLASLVQNCRNVIGFGLGAGDNVLHYDQDYYALKSIAKPLACLTSSESALFHTLNTGTDGVMSPLSQLAPHEVAALYQASRAGRFYDAQALHNRLSPLIRLLSVHDPNTRELICREVAHHRGLLASSDCRGIADPLCPDLKWHIHQVIDEISLKPISWV